MGATSSSVAYAVIPVASLVSRIQATNLRRRVP